MKKVLIVLVVILLVAAAALGGYYIGHQNYKIEDLQNQLSGKDSNTATEQNNTTANETNTQTTVNNNQIDTANMVTDLCNLNENLDGATYKFRLPQININSEDAKTINNEIATMKSNADKTIESIKNSMPQDSIRYVNYNYEYFVENDVLTLIISYEDIEGEYSVFFRAYNINVKTGKALSNEEIFKLAGQNISEYSDKMKEYSKNYIDPTSRDNQLRPEGVSYITDESLNADNCTFYVKNGKLIALVEVNGTDWWGTYKIDMLTGERIE